MVILTLLSLMLAAPPDPAEPKTQGREEFEAGTELFRAGDYEAAWVQFQLAYERSDRRPTVILALAQCERALGRIDAAIERFTEYLGTDQGQRERSTVEATIAALKRERPEKAEASKPPPPKKRVVTLAVSPPDPLEVDPAPAEPTKSSLTWVWWASAGAAAIGTGALIFALTRSSPEPYGGTSGLVLDPARGR